MLTGLSHGKLISFQSQRIEHEFVNNTLSLRERQAFQGHDHRWTPEIACCRNFENIEVELLRDWGTGLDPQLYNDAVTYFFAGPERVNRELDVLCDGHRVGKQTMKLIDETTTFKLTSLRRDLEAFGSHAHRLQKHTQVERLLWANVAPSEVTFAVISR